MMPSLQCKQRRVAGALRAAIRDTIADEGTFAPGGVMPASYEPGAPGSRLLVATGSNASGKSLVARFLSMILAKRFESDPRGFETLNIGMNLRTTPGMGRAFIFGDEGTNSTGEISLRAVDGLIRNGPARSRVHLAVLDEPDLGLSEDYAWAMGEKIAAYAYGLPPLCAGLIVVSHSRALVSRLMPLEPHRFRMCEATTTEQWIAAGPEPRAQADLDALHDVSLRRFRAFTRLMNERRAAT